MALLCLLGISAPNVACGQQFPTGDKIRVWTDGFQEREQAFFQREVLEPYRQQHTSPSEADQLGEEFLEAWGVYASRGYRRGDKVPSLESGLRAAEAGCQDPLFCGMYGRALLQDQQFNLALKQLSQAEQAWPTSGYHPYFHFHVLVDLVDVLYRVNRPEDADARREQLQELAVKAYTEHPYAADENWLHYYHMLEYFDTSKDAEVIATLPQVVELEDVDAWMRHQLAGLLNISLAWEARGNGFADSVTDEGWVLFEKHLSIAREHLRAAWEMNPELPFAATAMITVAKAGMDGGTTPREWFDRAVSAHFDFLPAYDSLRNALLPRWGGSHAALMVLGKQCLDSGRYDTAVPKQYYYSVARISSDFGQNFSVYQRPEVYRNLIKMADGYLAEPEMAFDQGWYRTFKIGMAYRAEQWEDAAQFLDEVNGPLDEEALDRIKLNGVRLAGEIRARSGDFAERHRQVDELLAAANYGGAVPILEDMLDAAQGQGETEDYLREKLLFTDFKAKYAAGDWVSILPNKKFDGWKKNAGKWSVSSRGQLMAAAEVEGLLLTSNYDLGTNFELRGKTTFVKSPYAKFNIGIWFGKRSSRLNDSFRYYRNEGYAAIYGDGDTTQHEVEVNRDNTFLLRRQGHLLTAYFNDEQILTDVYIRDEVAPEDQTIGIGGYYWYAGPIIRFDMLEVRQIDPLPGVEMEFEFDENEDVTESDFFEIIF